MFCAEKIRRLTTTMPHVERSIVVMDPEEGTTGTGSEISEEATGEKKEEMENGDEEEEEEVEESEEEEEVEESEEDDEDGDEDYVEPETKKRGYSVSPTQKAANALESVSRTRENLTIRGYKKGKKSQLSEAEMKAFVKKHLDNLREKTHTDDYASAVMSCYQAKDITVYQRKFSPFFYTCNRMGFNVFNFVQNQHRTESVTIDQLEVEENWEIPPMSPVSNTMKNLVLGGREVLNTEWNERRERVRQTETLKLRGGSQVREWEAVELPPCPEGKEHLLDAKVVRKSVYKLWIRKYGANNTDVRGDVLDLIVENLMTYKLESEFNRAVDVLAAENMKEYMEMENQTHHEMYKVWCERAQGAIKKTRAPKKRRAKQPPKENQEVPPTDRPKRKAAGKKKDYNENSAEGSDGEKKPPARKIPRKKAEGRQRLQKRAMLKEFDAEEPTVVMMEEFVFENADEGLKELLRMAKEEYRNSGTEEDLYAFALGGCWNALYGNRLTDIWIHHHDTTMEMKSSDPEFLPPQPVKGENGVGVNYLPPGKNFSLPFRDCLQFLHVALVSLVPRGLAPVRYHWKEVLNEALQKFGPVTQEEYEFACAVTLVLASATQDGQCIKATEKLREAGILSPKV